MGAPRRRGCQPCADSRGGGDPSALTNGRPRTANDDAPAQAGGAPNAGERAPRATHKWQGRWRQGRSAVPSRSPAAAASPARRVRLDNPRVVRIVKRMPNSAARVDLVFHALADRTRRTMVEQLHRRPMSVSELARPLAISLPAVIQHLQVLEASGLVRSAKIGRVRTCSIDRRALEKADAWFASRRATWERRFDRLGAILSEDEVHPSRRRR